MIAGAGGAAILLHRQMATETLSDLESFECAWVAL